MTISISAEPAVSGAGTAVFAPKAFAPQTSSGKSTGADAPEDSVKLSDAAQQHLTAPTNNQDIVERLVKDAAAGDLGALSLLTVA